MLEFDPTKAECGEQLRALEERDGRSVQEGRWRSIVARVDGCRSLGMTDAETFAEVSSWEVEPIEAMICWAIDGAKP